MSSQTASPAIQSSIISKCCRILDLLAGSKKALGFTEIVTRSGFVKSSTHRLIGILVAENLIVYDPHSKTYRLGSRSMNWAFEAWRKTDLQQAAAAELEQLAEVSGCNAALAKADADNALILLTVDNDYLSYVPRTGDRSPLHCTALGKVLIAFQARPQRQKTIDRLVLEKYTENTITSKIKFSREIDKIASQGYALSDGEEFMQICGIAVPIFDFQDQLAGSICIWSLKSRATSKDLLKLRSRLIRASNNISATMGYQQRDGG